MEEGVMRGERGGGRARREIWLRSGIRGILVVLPDEVYIHRYRLSGVIGGITEKIMEYEGRGGGVRGDCRRNKSRT